MTEAVLANFVIDFTVDCVIVIQVLHAFKLHVLQNICYHCCYHFVNTLPHSSVGKSIVSGCSVRLFVRSSDHILLP